MRTVLYTLHCNGSTSTENVCSKESGRILLVGHAVSRKLPTSRPFNNVNGRKRTSDENIDFVASKVLVSDSFNSSTSSDDSTTDIHVNNCFNSSESSTDVLKKKKKNIATKST